MQAATRMRDLEIQKRMREGKDITDLLSKPSQGTAEADALRNKMAQEMLLVNVATI